MKVYDPQGEYSDQEVRDALVGASGTRELSFRYERLDKDNQYIEDIDYIVGCTIENNSLADIKRTAKFDILDIGTINYLQDRIAPYVRVTMPKDNTYGDNIRTIAPKVWWKLDEQVTRPRPTSRTTAVPDGMTHTTMETAYAATPDINRRERYDAKVAAGSGTLRSEIWYAFKVDSSEPLEFKATPRNGTVEVYYARDVEMMEGDELQVPELLDSFTTTNTTEFTYSTSVPRRGIYYVRFHGTLSITAITPYVIVYRGVRVEDSSENSVYGFMKNALHSYPALVNDFGGSIGAGNGPITDIYIDAEWTSDTIAVPFLPEITVNYWLDLGNTLPSQSFSVDHTLEFGGLELKLSVRRFDNTQSVFTVRADFEADHYEGSVFFPTAHLLGDRKMVSYVINPTTDASSILVNGTSLGSAGRVSHSTRILSEFSEEFASGLLTKVSGAAKSAEYISLDDIAIFDQAIVSNTLTALFRLGTNSPPTRRGWVEWPQGVFVLSSPTRTMEDGNSVIREVEAYDQLVNLSEDSFSTRYFIPAGTKYTDAIEELVQSTVPPAGDLPMGHPAWLKPDTNVIVDGDVVTFEGANGQIVTESGVVVLKDASLTAKVPSSAGDFEVGFKDVVTIERVGTLLYAKTVAVSANVTYNSTNHAYVRVREDQGHLYAETSPNGMVWTQMITPVSEVLPGAKIQMSIKTAVASSVASVKAVGSLANKTDITPHSAALSTGIEWEIGTPKLKIVNDLLNSINYISAFYAADGVFVGKPYQSPTDRPAEYVYATDSNSVITGDVDQTVDLFSIPNKWILMVSEPDKPVMVAEYTNNNPLSVTSTVSRGRTIVDVRTEQDTASQQVLNDRVFRLATEASQVYEHIEFETALMPFHEDSDVYFLIVDGLAIGDKYSEQSWSMDLENGATMKHTCRRIIGL